MNKYKFVLNNYHAIGNAIIDMNGITVLAGKNGSGKSTISRWLYYLVEGTYKFQAFRISELWNELDRLSKSDRVIFRELQNYDTAIEIKDWGQFFVSWYEKIKTYSKNEWQRIDAKDVAKDISREYMIYVDNLISAIDKFLSLDTVPVTRKVRLKNTLIGNDNVNKFGYDRELYRQVREKEVTDLLNKFLKDIKNQDISSLKDVLRYELKAQDDFPPEIQFYEDDVAMLADNRFEGFLNLNNAIYVESPLVLEEIEQHKYHNQTNNQLFFEQADVLTSVEQKLLDNITQLIGGEIVYNKTTENEDKFSYIRFSDKLKLPIENIATGFKTFSYMIRLLKSGKLNEHTILIIDEPEVHLHPQWIIEYANLLVLLHKSLGVKILIATHNPDMVAAIQSIALKQEVIDKVTFYQAEQQSDSLRFDYKNLGAEINEIFLSFNIALERMQEYGANMD